MNPIIIILIIILLLAWIIASGFATDANVHLTSEKDVLGNAYIYTLCIAITTWTIIGLVIIFIIFFNEEIFLAAKRSSGSNKYFYIFMGFLVVANLAITILSVLSLDEVENYEKNHSSSEIKRVKFDLIMATVLSLSGVFFLLIYIIIIIVQRERQKAKLKKELIKEIELERKAKKYR